MKELMDIKTLCQYFQAGKKFNYLFFWGHKENKHSTITKACLSQWYPAAFKVEGITYACAEHFMMAGKAKLFADEESFQKIVTAKNPGVAKALGRAVKGFDQAVWDQQYSRIVIEANVAKFSQNPLLLAFLLGTGNKVLVEASPVDRIWGIGLAQDAENIENPLTWNGKNLLGFALMAVREQLLQNH